MSQRRAAYELKLSLAPVIDDSRVSFFKEGYSERFLSMSEVPTAHEQLIVYFDEDLYSSTKTVLDFLKPHISSGTLLYFGEFQAREHESKASDKFLSETRWTFRVVAASWGLTKALFQRTRA